MSDNEPNICDKCKAEKLNMSTGKTIIYYDFNPNLHGGMVMSERRLSELIKSLFE